MGHSSNPNAIFSNEPREIPDWPDESRTSVESLAGSVGEREPSTNLPCTADFPGSRQRSDTAWPSAEHPFMHTSDGHGLQEADQSGLTLSDWLVSVWSDGRRVARVRRVGGPADSDRVHAAWPAPTARPARPACIGSLARPLLLFDPPPLAMIFSKLPGEENHGHRTSERPFGLQELHR
jgi:hypothetical protein